MRHLAERHIACPVTRHNKIYTFDSVTTFRCALHYNAYGLTNDKYVKMFSNRILLCLSVIIQKSEYFCPRSYTMDL